MIKCTSYKHQYPSEAFVLDGKTYKTCATCLTNKAKTRANKKTISDHNQTIETIPLNDLNEYVMELIESLENDISSNLQNQHFNKQTLNDQPLNKQPLNKQPLNVNNKLSTQMNIKNDLIITDDNDENIDPDLHQQCKSKIVTLERLVKHLNDELSANNL
ncbi:15127_t:CDS:2 [Dentiscutata erythropus]|uniref:15127_t:CDS:1 n=1 Tax=Dentiscutata erythropus TaxID=1348616 RepID=A0A9N9ITZ5_9GLOM|nr:15127_t:CDS:2 [Dentiscutata erythropus]